MERLVIVGSLHENIDLVKEAKNRGYYTIVCDGYANGPAKKISDKSYNIDVRNVKEFSEMCIAEKADGIIGSFSDVVFEQITKIADKANLKWYANPSMLKYYRNKSEQKKLLKKIGVRVPKHIVIQRNSLKDIVSELKFPIVVKPINGWGSRGVVVLNSEEETKRFLENTLVDCCDGYEVEEYINAFEYNAISWVVNGKIKILGIADRERNVQQKNSIPILTRVVYPSQDYYELKEKVAILLQKFVNETGQKNGPISMQFFYKGNDIVVCEIAGRVLAHEHRLIELCGGSNINELLLDYVYGTTSDIEKDLKQLDGCSSACGLYLMCERNKTVKDLSAAKKALSNPHVVSSLFFCEEGHVFDDSYPYFIRSYLKADSKKELDDVTEEIYSTISVTDINDNDIMIPFYLEKRRNTL